MRGFALSVLARGEWRGEIEFADSSQWSRWFEGYERWILPNGAR